MLRKMICGVTVLVSALMNRPVSAAGPAPAYSGTKAGMSFGGSRHETLYFDFGTLTQPPLQAHESGKPWDLLPLLGFH